MLKITLIWFVKTLLTSHVCEEGPSNIYFLYVVNLLFYLFFITSGPISSFHLFIHHLLVLDSYGTGQPLHTLGLLLSYVTACRANSFRFGGAEGAFHSKKTFVDGIAVDGTQVGDIF